MVEVAFMVFEMVVFTFVGVADAAVDGVDVQIISIPVVVFVTDIGA